MQGAPRTTTPGLDLARVREIVLPVVTAHRLVLVDLEWTTERTGWILRVFVERQDAAALPPPTDPASTWGTWGVTLEQCAELSRDLSTALDVADLIGPRYSLEVSSPGLERKLHSIADFRRFAGLLVKVKLSRPAPDGQRVLRGPIAAIAEAEGGDDSGTIIAVDVDGKRIEVPYRDVDAANLVYELATQPKKSKARAAARSPKSAPKSANKRATKQG